MTTDQIYHTMQQDAWHVQDACNITGVLNGFARVMKKLRELKPDSYMTDPVALLWLDKVNDLFRRPDLVEIDRAFEIIHDAVEEAA